jgi:integrating conjugative element protein (TIGR03761 family)
MATSSIPAIDSELGLTFQVNTKSPFSDRYDLPAEQALVAAFRQSASFDELDPLNPLYPRLLEVQQRELAFAEMNLQNKVHRGAGEEIPLQTARKVDGIGALRFTGENVMKLHTREAFWLYTGRRRDPANANNPFGIPGAVRCAGDVRQLLYLSMNNNPYADFALLEFEEKMTALRQTVASTERRYQATMDEVAKRGLVLSVMGAEKPAEVALTYRSPYGFTVSLFLIELDYCFRVIESCRHSDLCTSQIAHGSINMLKKAARRLFAETTRFTRVLSQKDMLPLTRHDFVVVSQPVVPLDHAATNVADAPRAASASAAHVERDLALKRITAAIKLFGDCPADVLSMERVPRHAGRLPLSAMKQSGKDRLVLRQLASSGFSLEELERQLRASAAMTEQQEAVSSVGLHLLGSDDEADSSGAQLEVLGDRDADVERPVASVLKPAKKVIKVASVTKTGTTRG